MWNAKKSILLSICGAGAAILLVILFAALLPFFPRFGSAKSSILFDAAYLRTIMPSLYACCVPALISLISLLRMLLDIRKSLVFTEANVRRLRVISWCFFALFLILLLTALFAIASPAILLLAVSSGFFCLLIRVVKNVIDAARTLKEENDFTI
ncbi:MAG: DUF2975 domain-containing protein [Clostridiales Family XIII bacterium]|jgi:hypothetical protein|nr:DUF2975 domain-containing protein [Clostridiales Family XIII bacterium]